LRRDLEKKRDADNESIRHLLKPGLSILAEWTADQKWYEAHIIQPIHKTGKFLVTYLEYPDDDIEVTIGQIRLKGSDNRPNSRFRSGSRSPSHSHTRTRSRSRSREREREKDRGRGRRGSSHSRTRTRTRSRSREDRHRRNSRSASGSRSKSNDRRKDKDGLYLSEEKLNEVVLKQERDSAAAKGRNYARRPTSYYHSLTLPHEVGTNRKRSPTPPLERPPRKPRRRNEEKQKEAKQPKPPTREHVEKMKKLREMYGDASAKK